MSRRKRFVRNLHRRLPSPLPVRARSFVRFEHETEGYGLFSYIAEARGELDEAGCQALDEQVAWFERYLGAPQKQLGDARFWFAGDGTDCIAQAERLTSLLRQAGIPVVQRSVDRVPGMVRWSDPNQVAVIEFRDLREIG